MTAIDFSIVICNYNYEKFVSTAVQSCLEQDYPRMKFEVIVVDDGSTDDSAAVLQTYASHPQVHLIFQPNQGQAAAFCAAVEAARGRIICFLDSDDRFTPDKLTRLARHIDRLDPIADTLFLCHDVCIEDERSGKPLGQTWFDILGLRRYGPVASIDQVNEEFAFSIPAGQVMSRTLAIRIAASLPTWEWRRGADAAFGHSALMIAGGVHYLDEALAVYRVHGENFVACIDAGQLQYRDKPAVDARRWPKMLHYLESLVDSLPLDEKQRAARIGYVRRLERQVRHVTMTRRFTQPPVSLYVFSVDDEDQNVAALDACSSQTYMRTTVVRMRTTTDQRTLPLRLTDIGEQVVEDGTLSARNLARAYFADNADYFCIVDGGTQPDPLFVERHLHFHRFSALCGVTTSDIRFVDPEGALLHASVFRTGGLWHRIPIFQPPFTMTLAQWIFPPIGACVLRRSRLLDAFFERLHAPDLPDIEPFTPWLLLQYVQHTSGSVRIHETLSNVLVPKAVEASYARVVDPCLLFGADSDPEIEGAAEFLFDLYCKNEPIMTRMLPAQWRLRFPSWLLQHGGEKLRTRLKALADRHGSSAGSML